MAKEYIERDKVLYHKWEVRSYDPSDPDPVTEVVSVSSIMCVPAADVVGVPEWMTKDELLDILRAAREGRLKITAPPIETTCGSCRHFQPYPGMASGKCDCRIKRNRRGEPTGEVLYVTQSHKACRDDYEQRAE